MVKRCLLTGLVAGFLSISSTLYAGESEIILKDNTTASGLTVKEETANTTIARFRGDGNVGIGTSNPAAALDIASAGRLRFSHNNGDIEFVEAADLIARTTTSSPVGTEGALSLSTGSGMTRLVTVLNNGNVGIGTTNPTDKLDVTGGNVKISTTGSGVIFPDGTKQTTAASAGGGGGTVSGTVNNIAKFTSANAVGNSAITEVAGNVGIGTTAPGVKLDVAGGGIRVSGPMGVGGPANVGGLDHQGSGQFRVLSYGTDNATPGKIIFHQSSANNSVFRDAITIDTTGNVGIGTTSPQHPLHMGSGAHVTTGGVWTNASSREYKENIRDLTVDDAMQALDGLRPSRFNYKVDDEDEYVGFIAEDVPELVATRDRKGLSPMDLTAVITKVVQEQQRMLQAQQEAMDKMKQEITMLKSAVNYGVKGL